jgi:hypothetical protein
MQIEVFCMQISSRMKKNVISLCKLPRASENLQKNLVVRCLRVPNIVLIPNGRIPLCGGQILFELAHTLWGINRFMCL